LLIWIMSPLCWSLDVGNIVHRNYYLRAFRMWIEDASGSFTLARTFVTSLRCDKKITFRCLQLFFWHMQLEENKENENFKHVISYEICFSKAKERIHMVCNIYHIYIKRSCEKHINNNECFLWHRVIYNIKYSRF